MVLPRWLAHVNRRVTNPILAAIPRRWSPFVIAHHAGRSTGRPYATPIAAYKPPTGYVLTPTYGPGADWVRNVLAAERFAIDRRGKQQTLINARLIDRDDAWPDLPKIVRLAMVVLRVRWFVSADLA